MTNKPVVYVFNTNYDSIKNTVEAIFQKFPNNNFKDKLVWVKPNMLGNFKPQSHVTTHPSLVKAVIDKLISLEAKIVVGDNPGVPSIISENRVGRETGIFEASQGTFKFIGNEIVKMSVERDVIKENISVSKIVKDCDFFISLPKMKTHLHTFLTGAVKNSYGMVVGVQKPNFHRKYPLRNDFAALIAEIYALRKPDLVIMDGVMAMEGDGPNCPDIREVNRVIASTDGVALDHYVANIMGMDSRRIPILKYCVQNGYGFCDYTVEGDNSILKSFILPKTYFESSERNHTYFEGLIYRYVVNKRLLVDKNQCTKCLRCFKVCPSKAILVDDYPEIDSDKCILCYCCKENCKDNAITFPMSYKISQKILASIDNFKKR